MRIVYIASLTVPSTNASGLQIIQTCNALSELGCDVELYLLYSVGSIAEIKSYYNIDKRIKVYRTLIYKGNKKPNPFFYKIFTAACILSIKLKLPVTSDTFLYTREPMFAFFFRNYVLEVHTMPKKISRLYTYFLQKPAKLVCISSGLKKQIQSKRIRTDTILVAPDGVDLIKFNSKLSSSEARNILKIPLEQKVLVYTGSLFLRRGGTTVLSFLAHLPDNIECYVIGSVEDGIKIKASKLNNVHLVGKKSHSEMPIWQKAADGLLLISTMKDETLREFTSPMKLFEYMTSGNPIIASDVPSTREVLNHRNAILVEPDDHVALQAGVDQMFSDRLHSLQLAKSAKKLSINYSWTERGIKIVSFLKQ